MTLTDRGGTPALVVNAKALKKGRCKGMMTPKEKLKVHVQIERENARKLREWKQKQKKGDAA